MPTTRKRHSVTETPAVERALAPLRAYGVPIDIPDLVVRGAAAKVAEVEAGREDDGRRRALRERFLQRTRTAEGIDLDTALEVRSEAWVRR